MADDTTQQVPTPVVIVDSVSATQQAIAAADAQARADRKDETVPGGAYLVNGSWVDANGQPIKAPKGK
jgi:hypothetical protein